jgi:Bacterial regulatory helix-turn-helix protein, lysR family
MSVRRAAKPSGLHAGRSRPKDASSAASSTRATTPPDHEHDAAAVGGFAGRAVARELHLTRAAATLLLRKLEHQLGVQLFERDNHRVQLRALLRWSIAAGRRLVS